MTVSSAEGDIAEIRAECDRAQRPLEVDAHHEGTDRPDQRRRASHRVKVKRRRSRLGQLRRTLRNHASPVLIALLSLLVAGSFLAVGTVHIQVLLVVAPFCVLTGAFALFVEEAPTKRQWLPALIIAGLAAYSWLQSIALPPALQNWLSPHAGQVWQEAFKLLGESPTRWCSLSLDPAASRVEALKWFCYAAVFLAASSIARNKGCQPGVVIVVVSALVGGVLSVAHGLFEVDAWLTLYRPEMPRPVWAVSPLLNPNNFAGYLNLALFGAMGLLFARKPLLPRWLSGMTVVLLSALVVLTGSRGGVLALVLGFAASGIAFRSQQIEAKRRGGATVPAWIPLLGIALAGGGLALTGSTELVWRQLQEETTDKLHVLEYSRPIIRDYLWIGVGRGSFETAFAGYRQYPGHLLFQYAENFVFQWIAEWGLPVAITGLFGLAWALGPRRWGFGRRAVPTGIVLGVGVLLLHNLFDLATEITSVGIAVAVLLGSLVGDGEYCEIEREPQSPGAHSSSPPYYRTRTRVIAAAAVLGLGLAAVLGVATTAIPEAYSERRDIAEELQSIFSKPQSGPAVATFREHVKRAILRHPADPYLPVAGAFLAPETGKAKLTWLSHAIRRDPLSARPHLMIADTLARHGFVLQALLELRRSVELDPTLTDAVAQRTARLANNLELIERVVPKGIAGIAVLNALSQQYVGTPEKQALHQQLLAESLKRNPNHPDTNTILGHELLFAITSNTPPCQSVAELECRRRLEQHIAVIERTKDRTIYAVLIRARLLAHERKFDEAERWLNQVCQDVKHSACDEERLRLAAKLPDPKRFQDAVVTYVNATCYSSELCSNTHQLIGSLELQRGNPNGALSHFERAALENPTAGAWIRVTEVALNLGRLSRAETALASAKRLGGAELAEPFEKRLLEVQRQELSKTLGTK